MNQEPAATLVLGLDIGGTSSRAVLADLAGTTLGRGEAQGGNPNSHPPDRAAEQVVSAARDALDGIDPGLVARAVVGIAGVSKLADPAVSAVFERHWAGLGLACGMHAVSDGEVAFAAGTAEPDGTVLIAGTGAIAGRIQDHRLVRVAGGHGWLLGDEGSAFWLGREAVRDTLRVIDRDERPGVLGASVIGELADGATEQLRKALITRVSAGAPIDLATLAPLVTSAAQAGDPAATDIVARAARCLVDTALVIRRRDDRTPIVLAGGLVAPGNPVGEALRAELARQCPGAVVHAAGPGAAGAAWLAALDVLGDGEHAVSSSELHAAYQRA